MKSLSNFHKHSGMRDGHLNMCKVCKKEYDKKYYSKEDTIERCRNYAKEYANTHKSMFVLSQKKYRAKPETKQKRAIYGKEYRSLPYVKVLQKKSGTEWRKNNVSRCRANAARQYKNRIKSPIFRINTSISVAMCKAMKKQDISKGGLHWENLVGYTDKQLKSHLETLLVDEMSWDNYGKWHIDHIIPKSFFEYKSTEDVEFKMCWRLENLQPLWALDNLSKSNKLRPTG